MIGAAASKDPSAEAHLIETASKGLGKLREECTKVRSAALGPDAHSREWAQRHFKERPGEDGGMIFTGFRDIASIAGDGGDASPRATEERRGW